MNDLTIEHVTVIDGAGTPPQAEMTVRIRDGLIAAIVPTGVAAREGDAGGGGPVIDGSGKFLTAGLWETHAHLGESGGRLRPPSYGSPAEADSVVTEHLRTYLRFGITTVVDLGGRADVLGAARRAQQEGGRPGAQLLYCGGHFNWAGGAFVSPWMNRLIGTIGDARAEVDRAVEEEGIDLVKIVYSHGLPAWKPFPKLSPEVLRAIVVRAHAHGIPAAIHADSAEDILEAVGAGVDSAEHMFHPRGRDWREARARVFDACLEHGAYWPLTIVLFEMESHARDERWLHGHEGEVPAPDLIEAEHHPESLWRCFPAEDREDAQRRFEAAMETALEAHRAGVRMTISTDAGVSALFHGVSTHREMELHAEAGVPNDAILRMATINAAEKLGLGERFGTVEVGKVADLVVLDADPLLAITNLRRIDAVIKGGSVHRPNDLEAPPPPLGEAGRFDHHALSTER